MFATCNMKHHVVIPWFLFTFEHRKGGWLALANRLRQCCAKPGTIPEEIRLTVHLNREEWARLRLDIEDQLYLLYPDTSIETIEEVTARSHFLILYGIIFVFDIPDHA